MSKEATGTPEKATPPKGAKKPEDRKPKAEDGPATLTAEVSGEKFEVLADALDDFELLDDLGRLDDGDVSRLPSVLRRMLGTKDYRRAMDAIRDPETKRVTIDRGEEFVTELMAALDPS